MNSERKPDPVLSGLLEQGRTRGIRHAFFTRVGGVSEGIYQGLNIGAGSSDDPTKVAENRHRVCDWLDVESAALVTVYQVHSPDVVTATGPLGAPRPKADAIVTDRPGLALGVSTADCGPVLFADFTARVIGAAHAGWKGAFTGVLENTVDAMEALGAERTRIVAILGPSIGPGNYEVGPEFVQRFVEADEANEAYFVPSSRPGHAQFDLNRYTVDRLRKTGVTAQALNRCTYAEEDLFFSYRRSTHRNEPDYGRQISVIVLEDR